MGTKILNEKERCVVRVFDCFAAHQCIRRGVIKRGGKLYCRQHDPVAISERREAREKVWREKWDEDWKQYRLNSAAGDLRDALIAMVVACGDSEAAKISGAAEKARKALKKAGAK